jgi:hypothetical protein
VDEDELQGMPFEEARAFVERTVHAELDALAGRPDFQITLGPYQAWLLLQLLQQGYHGLDGDARDLAADVGRTIQDGYLAAGSLLRFLADRGWESPANRLHARTAPPEGPPVPEAFRRAFG